MFEDLTPEIVAALLSEHAHEDGVCHHLAEAVATVTELTPLLEDAMQPFVQHTWARWKTS